MTEGGSLLLMLTMLGGLMVCLALVGLTEYRKVFFANPREAMSLEVLLQLLFHPASTPALLSALLLVIGLWFLAIPAFVLLAAVGFWLWEVAVPAIVSHIPLLSGGPNVGR